MNKSFSLIYIGEDLKLFQEQENERYTSSLQLQRISSILYRLNSSFISPKTSDIIYHPQS